MQRVQTFYNNGYIASINRNHIKQCLKILNKILSLENSSICFLELIFTSFKLNYHSLNELFGSLLSPSKSLIKCFIIQLWVIWHQIRTGTDFWRHIIFDLNFWSFLVFLLLFLLRMFIWIVYLFISLSSSFSS